MNEIETYYNKFNEEKRLDSRHGQVEFITSMKYIHESLKDLENSRDLRNSKDSKIPEEQAAVKIMEIGAGTGRYSVALANEGYDVTAVELVRHNLGILKAKNSSVKAYLGNALKLKRFADHSFDLTLLFGPMYHLFGFADKKQALSEACRITRPGGIVMAAYCMNEYSVITYAFKEKHIMECIDGGRLDRNFHTISAKENLYDYMRIEDIDALNAAVGLERIKILSPDGAANYIRPFLNQLSEEEFQWFLKYHLSTCERPDLIGAGAHTLDILRKP